MNRVGFIAGWKITDQTCDGLIEYFEESPDKKAGEVGKGHDPESKISTDITVCPRTPDERIENYLDELGQVCDEYTDLFPWSSKSHALWGLNTNFNIQKYNTGGHFADLHSERETLNNMHRVFAWMTYLNNVDDGGETYFDHYDLKIKPEIGKTLIWPAEWTHAHKGEILKSGIKYIITGWMHFPFNFKN